MVNPGTLARAVSTGRGAGLLSAMMVRLPSAYYFEFNVMGAYPSRGPLERWHGFPLRCLSTVLGM